MVAIVSLAVILSLRRALALFLNLHILAAAIVTLVIVSVQLGTSSFELIVYLAVLLGLSYDQRSQIRIGMLTRSVNILYIPLFLDHLSCFHNI